MATRRPPVAMSKPRAPFSTSRSKSALGMHKSTSSEMSEEIPPMPVRTGEKRLMSRAPSPGPSSDNAETNIQVVVRCRGRSPREVAENTPIIISTNGQRCQEVTIETAATVSVLGVVTLAPTKTYPFDRVFGSAADQAMVYNDVVAPILDEVLQGYNCTLFAYGQTGTGKTYTMQGDLTPSVSGGPSAEAGMIPRVLFKLFHHLETNVADYSVKVSFVELYNEELRDLLAHDWSPPNGSTQPMGVNAGVTTNNAAPGLKIFDDTQKRGVLIQGLEEAVVKDASDAINWLRKGSHKRQVAATKFNDHSSRSHSIFTITVHTKESSHTGDDLLRVGKLNLVDLAGSENIGRSGAENKRAREAGHINQSLLTLGRVINALVDKSSHVPYRESKLTRLLQDSLGGRTKTCIIATVSPARSNVEETLSTLDYAIRAKSIRNKPEINQRMTKNSLLKEYVAEIERLKADLLAAREKNGVFFDPDHWATISAEHDVLREQHGESQRQLEMIALQMRAVRDEFEESMVLLHKRDDELREVKDLLRMKSTELELREEELRSVRNALDEEVVVREAHARTEVLLHGVAGNLRDTVKKSVGDVVGLFEKISRKSLALGSNANAVNEHGQALNLELANLSSKLEEFAKTQTQMVSRARMEVEQYQISEVEILRAHSSQVKDYLNKLTKSIDSIREKDALSAEAVSGLQSLAKETAESILSSFATWSTTLTKTCEGLCKEVELAGNASSSSADKAMKSAATILETVITEANQFIETERQMAMDLQVAADHVASAEILRLQQQNVLLTQLLDSEKIKAERTRDELIQRVSALLVDFTDERDKSLRKAVEGFKAAAQEGEQKMKMFVGSHGEITKKVVDNGRKWSTGLEKRSIEGKKIRDTGLRALTTVAGKFKDISRIHEEVSGSIATRTHELGRQGEVTRAAFSEAFDSVRSAKRARTALTDGLSADTQESYRLIRQGLASSSQKIERTVGSITNETTAVNTSIANYRTSAATHISTMRQEIKSLIENGTKEDPPTGATPNKRVWNIAEDWELTKSRDVIIREWRASERSSFEPCHLQPATVALPQDGDGDEEMEFADDDVASENRDRASSPGSSYMSTAMSPPRPTLAIRASTGLAPLVGPFGRSISTKIMPLKDKGNLVRGPVPTRRVK